MELIAYYRVSTARQGESGLGLEAQRAKVEQLAADRGAVVVANPIPEADEIPASDIEPVINAALAAADRFGIRGKDITPFLLGEIVKATQGRSLQANIALVKNNAKVAAEIASAFARL